MAIQGQSGVRGKAAQVSVCVQSYCLGPCLPQKRRNRSSFSEKVYFHNDFKLNFLWKILHQQFIVVILFNIFFLSCLTGEKTFLGPYFNPMVYLHKKLLCVGEQLDQKNQKRNKIMNQIKGKLSFLQNILLSSKPFMSLHKSSPQYCLFSQICTLFIVSTM